MMTETGTATTEAGAAGPKQNPMPPSRKPYEAPRITHLGQVEAVTQDGGGAFVDGLGTSQI